MNTLYEIFIMGFKKYGAEIVYCVLIGISIWVFPSLKDMLKKSLHELIERFNKPKPQETDEAETLEEDAFEEDYPDEREEQSNNHQEILEWFTKKRRKNILEIGIGELVIVGSITLLIMFPLMAFSEKKSLPNMVYVILGALFVIGLVLSFLVDPKEKDIIFAAELGDTVAMYRLGGIYSSQQNYRNSYVWYYLSNLCGKDSSAELKKLESGGLFSKAKISHSECETAKTEAYKIYEKIIKNKQDAFEYYSKAALQGDVTAQYNLGYVYQHGEGIGQDNYFAYVWYFIAQLSGDRTAKSRLEQLKSNFFPSQIAQAEEDAMRKFKAIQQRKLKK